MLFGKVGAAPGTTTLRVKGGRPTLVGLGYFDARPTDFEQTYADYLPRRRGWIVGQGMRQGGGGVNGLGCCEPSLRGLVDDFRATLKVLAVPAAGAAVGAFLLHGLGRVGGAAGGAAGAVAAVLVRDLVRDKFKAA